MHFRPHRETGTRHPPLDTTFFEKVAALDLDLTPALTTYIRTLIGAGADLSTLSSYRMEEFFKDAYFDFRNRPRNERIRAAYTDLLILYHGVLRETTNWLCDDGHRGGPIGRMIAAAADIADRVTIVTFNHDLLIENEIYRRARLQRRWCIDQAYGSFGEGLERVTTGGRPEFPSHDDDCDHDRPIRILKLHGSLNWIVRMHGRQPTVKDLRKRQTA